MKRILLIFIEFHLFISHVHGQGCNISAAYSAPISYDNLNGATISGLRIMNASGDCITLTNCSNIIIQNCILTNSKGRGISLSGCSNVKITNCSFEKNSIGIYALNSSIIVITSNKFSNSQGDSLNRVIGHFVQFDKVSGAGNQISGNIGEMTPGFKNYTDDLINVYKSNGTAGSPILVDNNLLRGGGPRGSSGGIIVGDGGCSSYITVQNNILVDPGQYGIAVAGGTNMNILNNQIFARQQYFTNVGIYVWDQYSCPSSGMCSSIAVQGNQVNYTNSAGILNSGWNANNCGAVSGWGNNNWSALINATILPQRLICPDLVAQYKFDNNTNEANGIYLLNGVQSGGLQYACGNGGYSANFNGVNNIVSIPLSDILKPSSQKVMLSAWVMPTDFSKVMAIAHSQDGDGWRLIVDKGVLDVRARTTTGVQDLASAGLVLNQWNFVAFSYDGASLKLYINGALVNIAPLHGDILYNAYAHTNNMQIGYSDGQNYFFSGRIDDVKLYRGVFTDSEFMTEYSNNLIYFNSNATRPNVSITYSLSLNVCKHSVVLTALPSGATSYFWTSSNGDYSGTSQAITVSDVETYSVLVNVSGCSNSTSITTVSSGSICNQLVVARTSSDQNINDEPSIENSDSPTFDHLTVYPNPSSNYITIAMPQRMSEDTPVLVYNNLGVVTASTQIQKGEWKTLQNVSGLAEGVYIIRIGGKNLINTAKLIVIH